MRYRILRFVGNEIYSDWAEIPAPRISEEESWRYGHPDPQTTVYETLRGDYSFAGQFTFDEFVLRFEKAAPTAREALIEKVQRLVERGATEGERAAARAALDRLRS